MTIRHDILTDPELHEPKGIATASEGDLYVANGTGSGSWSVPEPKGVAAANPGEVYVADGAGTGTWTPSNNVSPTVWDDFRVGLITTSAGSAAPPALVQVATNGAGSQGVYAYHFDATVEEEVFFEVQLPHRYAPGTDLKPHVHWAATTADAGNVVWALEYWNMPHNSAAAATTTILTTTDATPAEAHNMQIISLGTIDGTNLIESSVFLCRFFRQAGNAADTYTADAYAISIDFHFQIEKHGTDVEFPGA